MPPLQIRGMDWNNSPAIALSGLRAAETLLSHASLFMSVNQLRVAGAIPAATACYAAHGRRNSAFLFFPILKKFILTHTRKIMFAIGRHNNPLARALETICQGAIAGAAGGLAEIAWVTLSAAATGGSASTLARGVTTAAGASALFSADAVALGVAVHMMIAVALGVALAFVWRSFTSRGTPKDSVFPFMIAALAGVWIINFFIVLPIVSPAFVSLVPYSVSLISKLLFGLAAASAFRLLAPSILPLQPARIARRS